MRKNIYVAMFIALILTLALPMFVGCGTGEQNCLNPIPTTSCTTGCSPTITCTTGCMRTSEVIAGTVVDEAGNPVEKATIAVDQNGIAPVVSDSQGKFEVTGIKANEVNMAVTKDGMKSLSVKVTGEVTDVKLVMPAGEGIVEILIP